MKSKLQRGENGQTFHIRPSKESNDAFMLVEISQNKFELGSVQSRISALGRRNPSNAATKMLLRKFANLSMASVTLMDSGKFGVFNSKLKSFFQELFTGNILINPAFHINSKMSVIPIIQCVLISTIPHSNHEIL